MKILHALVMVLALLVATISLASPPKLINYQGKLTDDNGDPVTNSTATLSFALYDSATAGTLVWGPQEFTNVPVLGGYFNVILGGGQPIESADLDHAAVFLGISINGGAEISPRQQLLSAPYALVADTVQGDAIYVADNGYTGFGTRNPIQQVDLKLSKTASDQLDGIRIINEAGGNASVILHGSSSTSGVYPEAAIAFRSYNATNTHHWIIGAGGSNDNANFRIGNSFSDLDEDVVLRLKPDGSLWTPMMDLRDTTDPTAVESVINQFGNKRVCPERKYMCGIQTDSTGNVTFLLCCQF